MPLREFLIIVENQNVMLRKTRVGQNFPFLRPLKLNLLPVGLLAGKKRLKGVRLANLDCNEDFAEVGYPVLPAKAGIQNSFKILDSTSSSERQPIERDL
ncbi:MAG: hypothetical protein H6Q42_3033 [Deltaproteobacteria bacterium]|nr:hypothetical protein [Deltaproteobacteria bacterium]